MSVPTMIGRYRLGSRLGAGGYAVVWRAHDESLDTTVAIKVMADNWSGQTELRERFLAEARMLRRASSSRIVKVFDVGELPDGRPFFVMEHADRGTLEDRIAQGRLPLVEALRVTAEVARGAAELHRVGIVHRDLKPSNVLIRSTPDDGERLLIADLGVAKNLTQGASLTMSVGSAGYMAPEQLMPSSRVDARADVYSLGALGFDLVTGQQPPVSGPVLPKGSYPDLPESVRKVLKQALEPDRERRWPDAASLADRLDALANEFEFGVQPKAARRPPQADRVVARSASGFPHWVRGRRALLVGGLLVVTLGVGQLWLHVKNPVSLDEATASSTASGDGDSTSPSAVSPSAVASDLSDGDHFALLVNSGSGTITVRLINFLTGPKALKACRKDLGDVSGEAVCGVYYFTKKESRTRVLRVSANASIDYVSSLSSDRYTLGHLTGVDVDSLARVSKQNQQGKLLYLTMNDGVVDTVAPIPPICKDVEGISVDAKTAWTSDCVARQEG